MVAQGVAGASRQHSLLRTPASKCGSQLDGHDRHLKDAAAQGKAGNLGMCSVLVAVRLKTTHRAVTVRAGRRILAITGEHRRRDGKLEAGFWRAIVWELRMALALYASVERNVFRWRELVLLVT